MYLPERDRQDLSVVRYKSNNGLQVKSGWRKPNEQAFTRQT